MSQAPGASTAHSPLPFNQPPAYGLPGPLSPIAPYPQKGQRPPNNASPYSSPQLTNGTIPNANLFVSAGDISSHNAPYLNGNHFAGNHFAASPPAQSSTNFSNMAPPATFGTMGPPQKPVDDKPVDVNDLGDVLAGSGVDIREEEANLVGMTRRPGQTSTPHATGSGNADISAGYFENPTRGYSVYSQNLVGPRSSFYGAGTFNQPALTDEQMQQLVEDEQKAFVRRRAAIESHHEKAPFLKTGRLAGQVKSIVETRGLALPETQGTADRPRLAVFGTPQTETLAVVNGGTRSGVAIDILSLASLACKDHLRSLLEHAVWLSRSRKETSTGTVPSELKDLAVGEGRAEEIEFNLSSAPSKKRSFADTDGPSATDAEPVIKKVKTIAFPKRNTQVLNSFVDQERTLEEQRAKKRAARNASHLSGDGTPSGANTPGSAISGAQIGAALAEAKKMSKKEQKKASQFQQSDADLQKASAVAAQKALGGGGGPSWLKGAGTGTASRKKPGDWLKSSQSGGSNSSAAPSRANSTSQIPRPTTTAPVTENRALKSGEVREDAVSSTDIEPRDVLRSMELVAKEMRALARGYNKQD